MAVIIYGGSKVQVKKQLKCKHKEWVGPCIDKTSRYFKCPNCYCLERDFNNIDDYYEALREEELSS